MTNYNDGKWHGWQCDWENPTVHPETEVEVTNGGGLHRQKSKNTNWGAVIAFRVIKEHKEPREFWLFWSEEKEDWLVSDNEKYAKNKHHSKSRQPVLHVREVTE